MKQSDRAPGPKAVGVAAEADLRERIRRKSKLKGRQPTEAALEAVEAAEVAEAEDAESSEAEGFEPLEDPAFDPDVEPAHAFAAE